MCVKGRDKMAYTTLLNSIIEQSGLTVKEIAERCKTYGADVTPAYISTLRNNKNNRAPSDKVSRAIAKACECQNEEALVIEAYLDSAPEIIQKFFDEVKKSVFPLVAGIFENKFTTQQAKELENLLQGIPMAQFVTEIANQGVKYQKNQGPFNVGIKSTIDNITITGEMNQNIGLPVCDDGMKPQICKGDIIQFEFKSIDDYKTGDVICYSKPIDKKKIYVRKIVIGSTKKEITLLPINSDFTPENVKPDEITLLGKVVRVTSEIK